MIKVLYWEGDGFVLLYKRLENGKFKCLCFIAHNRKNWLFAFSTKGADASAAAFSLVETAKANYLGPFDYIEYLLEIMPNIDYVKSPEKLDNFLPWSEQTQSMFKTLTK